MGEDNLGAYPNRETKVLCALQQLYKVVLLFLFQFSLEFEGTDGGPHDAGTSEKNRRDKEGVVVAESKNKIGRCEGADSTSNLIEDMDNGIHPTELVDVPTNNVPWDDTTNELNHTVCNTGCL